MRLSRGLCGAPAAAKYELHSRELLRESGYVREWNIPPMLSLLVANEGAQEERLDLKPPGFKEAGFKDVSNLLSRASRKSTEQGRGREQKAGETNGRRVGFVCVCVCVCVCGGGGLQVRRRAKWGTRSPLQPAQTPL